MTTRSKSLDANVFDFSIANMALADMKNTFRKHQKGQTYFKKKLQFGHVKYMNNMLHIEETSRIKKEKLYGKPI